MNSADDLMNMILEDGILRGGEPENHHFDESLNKNFHRTPSLDSQDKDSNSTEYHLINYLS